ncbi:MAG: APC family permease [Candidatus Saccharicenans sp.]|jgi:amino acid transporter|nr:APC family permease [Candidatus Saccharicenans sp.]MDH7574623.1 APC family permease [Candidatus Saccharicenans sp.]
MEDDTKPLKQKLSEVLIGKPRSIKDPSLFHKLSLIPLLAWIGLGADGLSSASYGPEEAFRVLGKHTYLAIFLALATALTVFIISYAYSRIIEYFPSGGGGYIVATQTLGEKAGVLSGSALLVDYMLTVSVSIVSCGDAIFSFLPLSYQDYKIPFEVLAVIFLVILNLRGVKESITILSPIFLLFVLTHVLLIGSGIFPHVPEMHSVYANIQNNYQAGLSTLGRTGLFLLFLKAFSMGAGTFTGIEAVSNGLQILREPRVENGKKTMLYMASSLAVTAAGIFICYLLLNVSPAEGRTLNAILADKVFGGSGPGKLLAVLTIFSEGALLLVAAQTGFADGPRVMANMALDYWLPRRFASLSNRFTIQNGVLIMGVAAITLIIYSRGHISTLVVMYSINVFLTFSISELGMSKFFISHRRTDKQWIKHLPVHLVGLVVCLTILTITILEKFALGGWVTLVITSVVVALCFLIKSHYLGVRKGVKSLDELLNIPLSGAPNLSPPAPDEMTAILLVNGYNGFGLHSFLSIIRNFPGLYKNFIFLNVAEVDVSAFKDSNPVVHIETETRKWLQQYVDLARKLGFPAAYKYELSPEIVPAATDLVERTVKEFPRSTVFLGQLVFRQTSLVRRLLHNETAYVIQEQLHWKGITTIILPIRINI